MLFYQVCFLLFIDSLFYSFLLTIFLIDLGMVLAESAILETESSEKHRLFTEANEKFSASVNLKDDDPHSLVMWGDVLINQTIYDPEVSTLQLLDDAIQLSLKAESLNRGMGAVNIARASALQGHANVAKKWLLHADVTNNLPPAEALLNDPAFRHIPTDWLHEIVTKEELADSVQSC